MEKKYMAKATLGGYKEVDTWEEASYVMLTKQAFNDIIRDRNSKSDKIKALRKEVEYYSSRKDYYKGEYSKVLKELHTKTHEYETKKEQYEDLASKIDFYEQTAEKEASLNKNLIRIATERANKDRDIPKTHNGYLALSWERFTHRYNTGRKGNARFVSYDFYRIVFQTPWDCSLPLDDLYKRLGEDIRSCKIELLQNAHNDNQSEHIYRYSWKHNNINLNRAIEEYFADDDSMPHIMSVIAKSNISKGLWEVTFITDFEPEVLEKHRKKYA